MRLERDLQIEIARRAAVHSRSALAAKPQPLPVDRAFRDARAQALAVELELALGATRRFFQRDAHRRLEVLARDRHAAAEAAAAAGGAAEDAHLLEEVREIDVAHVLLAAGAEAVEPVGRRAEILAGTKARAERVVGGALFLVAQRLVGLRDLLELLLGVRLLGDVRVVLAREAPVSLLDLVVARAPLDAEDLVIVLVFHAGLYGDGPAQIKAPTVRRPLGSPKLSLERSGGTPRHHPCSPANGGSVNKDKVPSLARSRHLEQLMPNAAPTPNGEPQHREAGEDLSAGLSICKGGGLT